MLSVGILEVVARWRYWQADREGDREATERSAFGCLGREDGECDGLIGMASKLIGIYVPWVVQFVHDLEETK